MTTGLPLEGYRPSAEGGVHTVAVGLTGVAAVALAGRLLTTLVINAPGGPGRAPVPGVATAAPVAAALALVAVGASEAEPVAGVGLLFVGVFGLLAAVTASAVTPAAVAVVAGSALAVGGRRPLLDTPTLAVTGLLVVALGVGLASGVGRAVTVEPLAGRLALVGIGLTPVFAATDIGDLLGGAGAFAAVVVIGLSVPFVTGAVTLVSLGAVGSSLPLVAVAVAGAVTTASAAVRERRAVLLAGVALVALAGVPTTLGRALPFALGIAALVEAQR